MSDFVKCPTCEEYGWSDSHKCPPVFTVFIHRYGPSDESDRMRELTLLDEGNDPEYKIYDRDPERAAEKAVEQCDWHNSEGITTRCRCTVEDENGQRNTYIVEGAMVPEYTAEKEVVGAL